MLPYLIRGIIRDNVEDIVKQALSPVAPYLRRLGGGLVLMLLSVFSFLFVLMALIGSVFFALASLPYVATSLWTALIFFLVGLVFLVSGMGMLKRPRRR